MNRNTDYAQVRLIKPRTVIASVRVAWPLVQGGSDARKIRQAKPVFAVPDLAFEQWCEAVMGRCGALTDTPPPFSKGPWWFWISWVRRKGRPFEGSLWPAGISWVGVA